MFFNLKLYSLSLTYGSPAASLCFTHHVTRWLLINPHTSLQFSSSQSWVESSSLWVKLGDKSTLITNWLLKTHSSKLCALTFPFPRTTNGVLGSAASPFYPDPAAWDVAQLPSPLHSRTLAPSALYHALVSAPANVTPWDNASLIKPRGLKISLATLKRHEPTLTWGSHRAQQRHNISLVHSNVSKRSEIKILGIAAWVKLLKKVYIKLWITGLLQGRKKILFSAKS